jgi:uncharacterized protein (DUF849 family)
VRVCPHCGFIDPPEWKHSKYSYWIDNIRLEDFQALYPELAKELLASKSARDKDYIYRITKNKSRVERKAIADYGEQWTIPMERVHKSKHDVRDFRKVWFKIHPDQQKILVINSPVESEASK